MPNPNIENHMVVGNTDHDLAAFYGEWPEDENGDPLLECSFAGKPCTGCGRCEPEYGEER